MFAAKKLALERKRLDFERKKLASERGHVYLELATEYLKAEDTKNARSTAEEGLRLVCGPFYLAAQDQLHDLLGLIQLSERNERASGARCARVITGSIAAGSVERKAGQQSCQEK